MHSRHNLLRIKQVIKNLFVLCNFATKMLLLLSFNKKKLWKCWKKQSLKQQTKITWLGDWSIETWYRTFISTCLLFVSRFISLSSPTWRSRSICWLRLLFASFFACSRNCLHGQIYQTLNGEKNLLPCNGDDCVRTFTTF